MMAQNVSTVRSWITSQRAAALPEFALLFPLMVTMIMGTYDVGRALTINQKVISASQIIADLITRNQSIRESDLQDIILSGQMALDPYDRAPFGYDIASLEFDDDDDPQELWRVTDNMIENDDIMNEAIGLGEEGEGVVAVSVSYTYKPFFVAFLTDDIQMREVAFLRGRRSATITCPDC